jgi:hypothetical protein
MGAFIPGSVELLMVEFIWDGDLRIFGMVRSDEIWIPFRLLEIENGVRGPKGLADCIPTQASSSKSSDRCQIQRTYFDIVQTPMLSMLKSRFRVF